MQEVACVLTVRPLLGFAVLLPGLKRNKVSSRSSLLGWGLIL